MLETLRQPLEHGQVVIHRAKGQVRYPARFQLVLAANPCPCGRADGQGLTCGCTPLMRRRYEARFSGPLTDRVDIQVRVDAPSRAELTLAGEPESTQVVAARVREARERARHRLAGTGWTRYRDTPGSWIREQSIAVDRHLTRDLERAVDRKQLTMRGMDRVLRLAWTVATLDGRSTPNGGDIGTGLALRSRDRYG